MASVNRDKIVKFCEEYLKVKDFEDFCVNGLQIEGAEKVEKIITGVTISKKLIEAAIAKKAQMIMVHHGIFVDDFGKMPKIHGFMKNRIKLLLENNISLLGFHLPLDAHPGIGNSISLIKLLGLNKIGLIATAHYGNIGFIGEYKKPIELKKFIENINKKIGTNSYVIKAGSNIVKKVGIVSGAASPEFFDAIKEGIDTYICGDIRENLVREIEETGKNFISAGHYNTEKLGIQNLGKLIAKKFKVAVEFVDVPNEV